MYRSVLRPRWLFGHAVVLGLVLLLVGLGRWQLDRLDDRRAANAAVLRGTKTTMALDAVLQPSDAEVGDARYQRVEVRGRYDEADELLVRFRSQDGLPGYDVVTPLVVESGAAVLVDRGWVPLDMGDAWRERGTPPPEDEVSVIGLVRNADGDGRFRPSRDGGRLVVGSIATPRLEDLLQRDLYPGWLQLLSPDDPSTFPQPLETPDLGEGPHFTYALQWFSFSVIALVGWGLLVRRAVDSAVKRGAHVGDE